MRSFFIDFLHFIYKQAFACIFGGFLLCMILITKYYYPIEHILHRYDFLFISAVLFQIFLISTKLESWKEVWIIGIFHGIATIMELFKTHPSIGSWSYPGLFSIWIMWVPLFAGFMYSAVGSYIARVWRIFDFQYTNYPKQLYTIALACTIYINFFTHHFLWDFRYIILIFVLIIFGKTTIHFKPWKKYYSMNLTFGFFLVGLFIWLAENIATYTKVWMYPAQVSWWQIVGPEKILAWFLLMIISFVLVSLVHHPKKFTQPSSHWKNTLHT